MNVNLSIIFLCHNNKYIDICIDAVLRQIDLYDQVIVVDDNSDSTTLNILKNFEKNGDIILIRSDVLGNRSYNRNIGAKKAQNEVLVFLDGDIVIDDYAINRFKYAHEYMKERAFIGQKHAIQYDETQFLLHTSIPNYIELLKTKSGREQLKNNPLLKDKRHSFIKNDTNSKYNWTFYYTGLCSVDKDIFNSVGGFDESFQNWGSEDVDLGYRLSLVCEIGFVKNIHAFHIPHPRNLLNNELSNRKNILYMLKKYKTWEFEILCNFYGYGNLHEFEYVIQQMRLLRLNEYNKNLKDKSIFIDTVSQLNPNGYIAYNLNNELKTLSSLSVTLNFKTKTFETAFISDHIFIYPKILCARIIQEVLRISNLVYIVPTNDSLRIAWPENILKPKAQKQGHYFELNSILSYSFIPIKNSEIIKVEHISLPEMKDNIYSEYLY